jgi:quercetin dioxygenase-like cupin family protein
VQAPRKVERAAAILRLISLLISTKPTTEQVKNMNYQKLSRIAALATIVALPAGLALNVTVASAGVTRAFNNAIPNIPGKSVIAVVVDYEPGGKTPPHHHAKSAFVTGYVLSGAIRSQVDDGPVQVFKAGESFSEKPGAHHGVSENASTTEPAKLLAIFVVDTADTELTTVEKPQ